jgi:hypothetical protein
MAGGRVSGRIPGGGAMTPDEMRRLLTEDALRYLKPLTLEQLRHETEAEATMRRAVPFFETLPDNDPQFVELTGLVEDANAWANILQRASGGLRWTSDRDHRERLFELLRYAREYRAEHQE